jgi:type VI secretion system protein ImpF
MSMSRNYRQATILPSVLDRLLDDAPDQTKNAILTFSLPDFKAALARDLESLLNTRVVYSSELVGKYPKAHESVLNYGIPDLSSLSLRNPEHKDYLRDQICEAIKTHDKRLHDVSVTFITEGNTERLLHFRVDALLKIHPARPPVSFDATLQLSSNVYHVRGTR